jgi:hypothetical protein
LVEEQRGMFIYPKTLTGAWGGSQARPNGSPDSGACPVLLPDSSIRFDWSEIEPLIVRVQAVAISKTEGRGDEQ